MKISVRIVLSLFAMLLCKSVFGQLSSTGVLNPPSYNTMLPPAVGNTYTDPVFGATVKRVSNALATPNSDRGGYLTWIENEYSAASAFNNDNSKFILLHQSYFALYDGATGLYIHDLPLEINSGNEPRWSRTDLVTLYYHYGNQLKSYNVSTGGINVVHTFSSYTSISGLGEMDISKDGNHFVFVGNSRYAFVYEISTDKVYPALDMNGHNFDSVYITPNNEVIVSWLTSGTSRYTGQELFDINMNFLRQLSRADGHKHLTVDDSGAEVLVWTNSNDPQPIANCNNGIVKITLATAAQTCLLQLDWSLAVHITAPDGNGSVYVDTEAPANPVPGTSAWVPYADELLQVKLDGSGTTRWAHHRSRPLNSYNWQPKLTISRDGSKLLYASDFDLQSIYSYPPDYSDTYLIVLGSGGGSGGSGGGSGGSGGGSGSSTTHYEQNNAAVQYSGSWYPNSGSFNSGGSAVLSMDAGSRARFTFTGTGVKWIGFSDAWSGIATVYVDGVAKGTIDTYSPTQGAQKNQYSITNLTSGTHTLGIVVSGKKNPSSGELWVWVDAFDVIQGGGSSTNGTPSSDPPAAPAISASPVQYQQNDPAVQYAGSWYTNTGAFNSGSSATLSMDPASQATFTFTGTGVAWIGFSDPWSGIATVLLDGVPQGTIDTYSGVQTAQKVQYSSGPITAGAHTLTIMATGQANTSAQGAWVWLDAFSVTP